MMHIKLRNVDADGVDLGIDTRDYFSPSDATKNHPKQRKPKSSLPEPVAAPPDDLPYTYAYPPYYPQAPAKSGGFLSKLGKTLTILRGLSLCYSLVTILPAAAALGTGVCAVVAMGGGYELNKAPSTEAGKMALKVDAAKKGGILDRAKVKIKDVAGEPLETVKEKAKTGVEKATTRVEEVKEKVEEAKSAAVEKVDELKQAVIGAKATNDAPAQPGILERAGNQIAAIPAAILPAPMTPEQVKAAQDKQKAEIDKRKRGVRRAGQNRFIDGFGGALGGMAVDRNRVERENQQRGNEAAQWNQIKHEQYRQSMGVRY